MLREIRSTIAVVLGMFLSLLVFMMAVNCYILCTNISKDYEKDTKFEYMYNLKYPTKEPPKDSEAAYAYTCKKKTMGYNFDITIVMYLMMKVMIDRSSQNISLIKVFGYRRKEIRKLYLDGNFYVIAVGALISLPLSKFCMNKMFPFMISNVACGLNVKAPLAFYVVAFIIVLILYFVINTVLVRSLDKFTPAEILKNRE